MTKALPSSLVELRRAIADGTIAPADALRIQGARVGDDKWNCVIHTFDPAGSTLDSARPLTGVGVAHKDMFVMRNHQPLCGSRSAPDFSPTASPLVQRLSDAGATTLGTLAMAEFAAGVTGENVSYPLPVNPLNKNFAVGGSSSGSAVAVAAGLCYGSLGTDTAGSVRIPAATCGVFALKPTNGVLTRQGCFPLAPSLDTAGIIARSALDGAVLFALSMAPEQCATLLPEFTDVAERLNNGTFRYQAAKKPVRVALALEHSDRRFNPVPDVRAAITNVAERFSENEVQHHSSIEEFSAILQKTNTILHVEASATHFRRLRSNPSTLSAITRAVVLPGAVIPGSWYAIAQQDRDAVRSRFLDRYFSSNDILLTPVLPRGVPRWESVLTGSPRFDSTALLSLFSWTAFVNYLGLPAVVFPVGQDANGLPISVQAIARPYSESTLLVFAHQVERKLTGSSIADRRSF